MLLGEDESCAHVGVHVRIGEVMDDLPRRPSRVPIGGVELCVVEAGDGGTRLLGQGANAGDVIEALRCFQHGVLLSVGCGPGGATTYSSSSMGLNPASGRRTRRKRPGVVTTWISHVTVTTPRNRCPVYATKS